MNQDAFMRMVADELVRELTPNATIKKFADNSEVIGAFAEAIVRRFRAEPAGMQYSATQHPQATARH